MSASFMRSGMNRPTSLSRMNVPIAEKPITQSAAIDLRTLANQSGWMARTLQRMSDIQIHL